MPSDHWKQVASEMYGVPYDEVTPEQRRAAKTVNFKQMYNVPTELRLIAEFSGDSELLNLLNKDGGP